jgi:hypothetical protein
MPLPFAPPPKDSSLYQQLESTTLQTLTADQLDTIKGKTFSQGTQGNEDEYRRLLLLGLAADQISLGGPIPGTQKITTSGVITSTGDTTLFQPDQNQVWVCVGVQMDASGGSGSVTAVLNYYDGANKVRIEMASTAGTAEFNITSTAGPLYVSNEVYPVVTTSSLTAGEQVIYNAAFIRVR